MSSRLVSLSEDFSVYVGGAAGTEGEAKFIHKEVFEDRCYDLKTLPKDKDLFMVDVGANIGMFTLYMKRKYPSSKILAFEPAPETYAILQQNLAHHAVTDVETFPTALSAESSTKTLTFFPNAPGNSTLHPEEKEKFKQLITVDYSAEFANAIYGVHTEVQVSTKTLSSVLRDYPEQRSIDLLKIDVEGAELEVLMGIDDKHWKIITNVVVEVCDFTGLLAKVTSLLESKGFTVKSEIVEWDKIGGNFFMVEATRI